MVTTAVEMKKILVEEWGKITLGEINKEIARLPKIMKKYIIAKGGNNYQA